MGRGSRLHWSALRAAGGGSDLIPVPVDRDGLDVGAGLQKRRNARAAYVTPSHQFPTGAVMSMRRRLELLSWAKDNDAWIIEDDYDSEFRYVGRPLASLQGIDQCSRVIYIGTLSKILFPGIRLGFAVVPKDLIEVFTGAKFTTDRQPPTLQQAMVADFMRFGFLTSHIRRMRVPLSGSAGCGRRISDAVSGRSHRRGSPGVRDAVGGAFQGTGYPT